MGLTVWATPIGVRWGVLGSLFPESRRSGVHPCRTVQWELSLLFHRVLLLLVARVSLGSMVQLCPLAMTVTESSECQ